LAAYGFQTVKRAICPLVDAMDVVILAAGRGTRLLPLTATRPKPMVPFLNRPLMDYVMARLREVDAHRVFILVDYLGHQIVSRYKDWDGYEVVFTERNEPLGTAGAVGVVAEHLEGTFLVFSGDVVSSLDLPALLEVHRETGAEATMALSKADDPTQYGIAFVDEAGRVTHFLEKPSRDRAFSNLVNAGIYVFEPEAFRHLPEKRPADISRDLFPRMLEAGASLYGYPFDEYWNDVGRPGNYLMATEDCLSGRFRTDVTPAVSPAQNGGFLVTGRSCTIGRDVSVGNFAILGDEVEVRKGALLNSCVILPHTVIDEKCNIRESIVGERCVLERGVTVRAGSVVGDGCYIRSGTILGYNTRLWPGSRLGEGTVINPD
jgi:mannose-1-phosphate guanylyltransferase